MRAIEGCPSSLGNQFPCLHEMGWLAWRGDGPAWLALDAGCYYSGFWAPPKVFVRGERFCARRVHTGTVQPSAPVCPSARSLSTLVLSWPRPACVVRSSRRAAVRGRRTTRAGTPSAHPSESSSCARRWWWSRPTKSAGWRQRHRHVNASRRKCWTAPTGTAPRGCTNTESVRTRTAGQSHSHHRPHRR